MKRRTLLLLVVICLCVVSVVLWYQSAPSPTQKAIQKVLDDPTTETEVKQQTNLPKGMAPFITWYVPRVKNASPEVQALMKKYDAKFRGADEIIHMALEEMFPTDEWLQRYLDMGAEISDFSDYSGFLNTRWGIYHAKNEEDGLRKEIDFYELAPNASWEDVIKTVIHRSIRLDTLTDEAMAADPEVYGGDLSINGVFTPIRHKTVYVNVTPKPHGEGGSLSLSSGSGVERWVLSAIENQAMGLPSKEIPEDITVIYLDDKGTPIPTQETEPTPIPPSEQNPTTEREPIVEGDRKETGNGKAQTVISEHPPSVTGKTPDRSMSPKTEPFTFDELPKSEADWEQLLSESPLSELENRLSEDGLQSVAKTLTQYGVAEGLKRIEAEDPALAEQVRQRMTRNKRANQRRTTTPVKPVQAGHENGGKQ